MAAAAILLDRLKPTGKSGNKTIRELLNANQTIRSENVENNLEKFGKFAKFSNWPSVTAVMVPINVVLSVDKCTSE